MSTTGRSMAEMCSPGRKSRFGNRYGGAVALLISEPDSSRQPSTTHASVFRHGSVYMGGQRVFLEVEFSDDMDC